MASYHCSINSGTKGKAGLHESYITREGTYAKKSSDLEYKEHGNMPAWAKNNPGEFWKAANEY